MWRNRIIFALAIGAIVLLISLIFCFSSRGADSRQSGLEIRIPQSLEEGDLVLRRGNSLLSGLIAKYFPDAKGMSHVGIIIRKEGSWHVVHSISGRLEKTDGIRIDTLDKFCSEAHEGEYHFISPLFEIDRGILGQRVRHYLAVNTPFDHSFDLEDDNQLYCSELIRSIYLQSGAEDIFHYGEVAGIKLIDLASFFDERYWQCLATSDELRE